MAYRLVSRHTFSQDVAEVFCFYRDRVLEVFPRLPNMKKAKILKEKKRGSKTRIVVECEGEAPIPKPLQPFVSRQMLVWIYDTDFDMKKKSAQWSVEAPYFKDSFQAQGQMLFKKRSRGSEVVFNGKLRSTFPVVGGLMERVVAHYVKKNLRILADEIRSLLSVSSS